MFSGEFISVCHGSLFILENHPCPLQYDVFHDVHAFFFLFFLSFFWGLSQHLVKHNFLAHDIYIIILFVSKL